MCRRLIPPLALILVLAGTAACGPDIDLSKSLKVTDVLSGFYDDGLRGQVNHLVPSISFRLQNVGSTGVSEVDVLVSFWKEGDDGEWDSASVPAIGATLAPGAMSGSVLVRGTGGYNLAQPRAELFQNREFKDVTAKIFVKRSKFVPLGEFKLEHRIIPHMEGAAGPR